MKGIKRGRYQKLRTQDDARALYLIDDIGRFPFKVVYCEDGNELVTILYLTIVERDKFSKSFDYENKYRRD